VRRQPMLSVFAIGPCMVGVATASPAAASPNTFVFTVSNTISPEQPSCTVTLWGAFFPKLYAFGESSTNVLTSDDAGGFSDPAVLLDPLKLSRPGDVSPDGDSVSDVYIMQLYIPFSVYPSTSNPIALWSATWTTDDFSPRVVRLDTLSESYKVYRDDGELLEFFGTDFAEGSGLIQVIPAPGAAVVLFGVCATARRRRPARFTAPASPSAP
jgi:hypothetical protein